MFSNYVMALSRASLVILFVGVLLLNLMALSLALPSLERVWKDLKSMSYEIITRVKNNELS